MIDNFNIANGRISYLLQIFNNNIERFFELKINILEKSEDEKIHNTNLKLYYNLKEYLLEILNQIDLINEVYFFCLLDNYVIKLYEKYNHIINLK